MQLCALVVCLRCQLPLSGLFRSRVSVPSAVQQEPRMPQDTRGTGCGHQKCAPLRQR